MKTTHCYDYVIIKLVENPMLNVVAHKIVKPFQSWKNLGKRIEITHLLTT
jgi:hypothetical protein